MNTEMIINELVRHGYQKVPQPLHIADINFDFAGALTGPNNQESLTLVLDGDGQSFAAAQRRLQAFVMVLERTGSTRPINVVVLAKKVDVKAITALEEVARVVLVNPDRPLEKSLNVLMPLKLPEPIASSGSAETALEEELGGRPDAVGERLLKAASESADKVESTMRKILQETAEEQP
jgi:hypothetical protein